MSSAKKKLFLNYANSHPDDIALFNSLALHLSILKDKIDPWFKGKILAGEVRDDVIHANLKDADAVIHLLSIHFENEAQCVELLKNSVRDKKKNFPILISSFDWESDLVLMSLKDEILPKDGKPIDAYPNSNEILTNVVKMVRSEIFDEEYSDTKNSSRNFYYILAGILFLIGGIASFWVFTNLNDISLSIITFLMTCCIILFVLRKVVFPTNISALK